MELERVNKRAELKRGIAAIESFLVETKPPDEELAAREQADSDRWYSQFERGIVDEELYRHPRYLWHALTCWRDWSYANVNRLLKFLERLEWQPESVVDLGAGIGLTTHQLTTALPQAQIAYFNLRGPQWDVAEQLTPKAQFTEVLLTGDLVVGLEFFEHLEDPVTMLESALTDAKAYVDASSFTIKAHGHRPIYNVEGQTVGSDRIRRAFNGKLRKLGFRQASLVRPEAKRFYNDRPGCWLRADAWM